MYGGKQSPQPRRIFFPSSRLDPAGHIHRVRPRNANGLANIFRLQPACKNNATVTRCGARQFPIERAPRAAVQATRETVEEYRIRSAITRERRNAESPLHLNRLNHPVLANQFVHFAWRLRSVKLHRTEPQRASQRTNHQWRPIYKHADGFHKRRQAPDDAPCIRGADGTRAWRVKIET